MIRGVPKKVMCAVFVGLLSNAVHSSENSVSSFSTDIAATSRYYFKDDANESINQASYGGKLQLDFEHKSQDIKFSVRAFASWDKQDQQRRYFDLREANIYKQWGDTKVGLGIDTFFWGVSESINVVNVLNQSDIMESFDGKVKLGQPFISVNQRFSEADISVYYLPFFRARQYPERPSFGAPISENSVFEDGKEHGGIAIRAAFYIDDAEFAVGYFKGTRRAPLLIKQTPTAQQITPYYLQTDNLLFDGLWLGGSLTYKAEVKLGIEQDKFFVASNLGIEYPVYSLPNYLQALSLIVEYTLDDRGDAAESHGQNDLFLGAKIDFSGNSESSIRGLLSHDFDHLSQYAELSYWARFNDYFRFKSKAIAVLNSNSDDKYLYALRDQGFVEMSIHYAF